MVTKAVPNIGAKALEILLLLDKEPMHVRQLRGELNDFGAISRYLRNLESLSLIKRQRRGTRVVNTVTDKGRHLIRTLKALKV